MLVPALRSKPVCLLNIIQSDAAHELLITSLTEVIAKREKAENRSFIVEQTFEDLC